MYCLIHSENKKTLDVRLKHMSSHPSQTSVVTEEAVDGCLITALEHESRVSCCFSFEIRSPNTSKMSLRLAFLSDIDDDVS